MERVVSAAVSTRTAMGFGSGGGWRRGLWQNVSAAAAAAAAAAATQLQQYVAAAAAAAVAAAASRVDSQCYGVWEWRRVAPGALASVYVGLSSSA